LYEKIRDDIIQQREREWVIYKKEWKENEKSEAANQMRNK
jgi:hypothetical protein